jgi:predicted RNase H-like HicB family nuclease
VLPFGAVASRLSAMEHAPLPLTYRAVWTDAVDAYVGTCDEMPGVTAHHADPKVTLRKIRELVEGMADDMRRRGVLPPELLVRKKPDRELALRAEHEGPSAESLAEMPEMDLSKAVRQPNRYAERIAREGVEIIVHRAGSSDDEKAP